MSYGYMSNLFFDDEELSHPMYSSSDKGSVLAARRMPGFTSKNKAGTNINALSRQKDDLRELMVKLQNMGVGIAVDGRVHDVMFGDVQLDSFFRGTYYGWSVGYRIKFWEKIADKLGVRDGKVYLIGETEMFADTPSMHLSKSERKQKLDDSND